MYARLGNGHPALFHHLVDGRAINVGHFIKLINAHDTTIG
jgi:hypothetical protein